MESRRQFLGKTGMATAALYLAGNLSVHAAFNPPEHEPVTGRTTDAQVFLAGFAEVDITPEIGMEQPGGYGKAFHKSFHDPCKVRVACFDDGQNLAVLVGVDALMVPRPLVLSIRDKVHAECGIPREAILIGASHSHSSGPTGMIQPGEYDHASPRVQSLAYEKSSCADPKYLAQVEQKAVQAICKAYKTRESCVAGAGKGIEDQVAFNRRFRMNNGLTYTHPRQGNPDIESVAGPVDPEVLVLGTWNQLGKCTGCIVSFACHATTSPGGISANWIYYMEQTIRGAMGPDCVVVFLAGASGDLTQVDNLSPHRNRAGEEWARFVGARVGAEAVKTLLSMPRGPLTPVNASARVLKIDRRKPDPLRVTESYDIVGQGIEAAGSTRWTFAKEIVLLDALIAKYPFVDAEIQAIQVGPAVFVTNPAEFFCQLGLDIKEQSPFIYTIPVSLANGCVGYVPDEEAFSPSGGGYETRLTSYSNLDIRVGTRFVETGVELARQFSPGEMPVFQPAPDFNGIPWEYGSVKPELK